MKAPPHNQRPTPAALREMQAIRRLLGLPAWPWPIEKARR